MVHNHLPIRPYSKESWNIFGGNGKVMSERNRELQEVGFQTLKQNEKKQTNRTSEEAISDR